MSSTIPHCGTIECLYCGIVGFVRTEYIIRGPRTLTNCYCGTCNRSWMLSDAEQVAADDRPRRSRT